ncbi:MAG: aldehyde dehydrogenase family protein [Bacteroidales bacterium]|nr:aldehyde dehydrogenase family protein [Bacteroidales bacterium]MBN2817990.1 aldehyde dehydrogenase family protein [Bacteroidales bacterium]
MTLKSINLFKLKLLGEYEEVFDPVASLISFKGDFEAVRLSNISRFSLGATIFTSVTGMAKKLILLINDGAVFVNSLVKSDPRLPFGGTKNSGYVRELSRHGIIDFVNIKTVYIT